MKRLILAILLILLLPALCLAQVTGTSAPSERTSHVLVCYPLNDVNQPLLLKKFATQYSKLGCSFNKPQDLMGFTMYELYEKGFKLIQVVNSNPVIYYFEKK